MKNEEIRSYIFFTIVLLTLIYFLFDSADPLQVFQNHFDSNAKLDSSKIKHIQYDYSKQKKESSNFLKANASIRTKENNT